MARDTSDLAVRESDEPLMLVTTTPERLRALVCHVKAGRFNV